jgi:hypothetical protein
MAEFLQVLVNFSLEDQEFFISQLLGDNGLEHHQVHIVDLVFAHLHETVCELLYQLPAVDDSLFKGNTDSENVREKPGKNLSIRLTLSKPSL